MENAAYRVNDANRCAHCKDALMDALEPIATGEQATMTLGVNVDDLGDHRPGIDAARRRGARFPLVDAGFTKAAVRAAARELGLATWDKPAAPCLASRLPYGTPVSAPRPAHGRRGGGRTGRPGLRGTACPALRRPGAHRGAAGPPGRRRGRTRRGRGRRAGRRVPLRDARPRGPAYRATSTPRSPAWPRHLRSRIHRRRADRPAAGRGTPVTGSAATGSAATGSAATAGVRPLDRQRIIADRSLVGAAFCRAYSRRVDEWLADTYAAAGGSRPRCVARRRRGLRPPPNSAPRAIWTCCCCTSGAPKSRSWPGRCGTRSGTRG